MIKVTRSPLAAPLVLGVLVLCAFGWTLLVLVQEGRGPAHRVQDRAPSGDERDIVKKTVAPGAIVPRREVAIKPRVSGVIDKLTIEPGDYVKDKALIATIQIIPERGQPEPRRERTCERRRSATRPRPAARWSASRSLHEQRLISDTDFNQQNLTVELKRQELEAAREQPPARAGGRVQEVGEGLERGQLDGGRHGARGAGEAKAPA